MSLTLPPQVAVFGSGPSNVPDLINWNVVPAFRIAVNAAAFLPIPRLTAATAHDFEALDDFGKLPKPTLIIHSVPDYRGKFLYELYSPPYPNWYTTANLIFTLAQYGVRAIHFIGFDSWSYAQEDYDRLFSTDTFYSHQLTELAIPWQKRRFDPRPYMSINRQIALALAHTNITGVFRHLDPDLWNGDQRPDNTLPNQTGPIQANAIKVYPPEAATKPIDLRDQSATPLA